MKGLFKKFKFKKLNKPLKIIVIVLICFALVVPTITFSKYIYDLFTYSIYNSQNFYFNSDFLSESNPKYTINNWSGNSKYTLNINMNSILNDLKKATTEIEYDISVECVGDVTCVIGGTNLNTGHRVIPINQANEEDNNKDAFTIELTPGHPFNSLETTTIKITVSSTKPYIKTLKGEFTLTVENVGLSYEITDNTNDIFAILRLTNSLSSYKVLEAFGSHAVGSLVQIDEFNTLSAADKEKLLSMKVKLTFDPQVVQLDMTNPYYLAAVKRGESQTGYYYVATKDIGTYKKDDIITQEIYNGLTDSIKSGFSGRHEYVKEFSLKLNALTSADIKFYKSDKTANYTYRVEGDTLIIGITVTDQV